MDTLQDAYDELRAVQEATRHYENESGLHGTDRTWEIRQCGALEAKIRGRIVELLDRADLEDSYAIQNELVLRYAKRHRMSEDNAARYWEKNYSEKFRVRWNEGFKTVPELEFLIFEKS